MPGEDTRSGLVTEEAVKALQTLDGFCDMHPLSLREGLALALATLPLVGELEKANERLNCDCGVLEGPHWKTHCSALLAACADAADQQTERLLEMKRAESAEQRLEEARKQLVGLRGWIQNQIASTERIRNDASEQDRVRLTGIFDAYRYVEQRFDLVGAPPALDPTQHPSEEGTEGGESGEFWAMLRPASRAHVKLEAAVLVALEAEIKPETIRRFVDEALTGAGGDHADA